MTPADKKQFYNSNRWKHTRTRQLIDHPFCFMCNREGVTAYAKIVDHTIGFESISDPLATDRRNLVSLCKSHHDSVTAQYDRHSRLEGMSIEEARGIKYQTQAYGEDGYPIEPEEIEDKYNTRSLFDVDLIG